MQNVCVTIVYPSEQTGSFGKLITFLFWWLLLWKISKIFNSMYKLNKENSIPTIPHSSWIIILSCQFESSNCFLNFVFSFSQHFLHSFVPSLMSFVFPQQNKLFQICNVFISTTAQLHLYVVVAECYSHSNINFPLTVDMWSWFKICNILINLIGLNVKQI